MIMKTENMRSEAFAHVTYVVGDTKLDPERTNVVLEAHSVYLLIRRRSNGQSLLAIPWANIRGIEGNLVEKSYTGRFVADVLGFVPLLNMMQISSKAEYGLTLIYWDEDVQREQSPTFAIGGDPRRFETLQYAILLFRDQFVAPLGPGSRPDRR